MVQKITEDMIRRRAEHNMGMLGDLKELSLHQMDITHIRCINQMCKELQILYLQNNLIGRIENLHRLKDLSYLNMALNNIIQIENLEECESLKKFDLTANFVDAKGLLTVPNLRANEQLEELFMTGCPCTQLDAYRPFVVGSLPQLRQLDGKEISPSERILAVQELEKNRKIVERAAGNEEFDMKQVEEARARLQKSMNLETPTGEEGEEEIDDDKTKVKIEEIDSDDEDQVKNTKRYGDESGKSHGWTPAGRVLDHLDLWEKSEEYKQEKKEKEDTEKEKREREEKLNRRGEDGRILQTNEGNWKFSVQETNTEVILEVGFPKYLSTELIHVEPHPEFVRIEAKGKVIQLRLPAEVITDKGEAKRSQMSGALVLTFPRLEPEKLPPAAVYEATAKEIEAMAPKAKPQGLQKSDALTDESLEKAKKDAPSIYDNLGNLANPNKKFTVGTRNTAVRNVKREEVQPSEDFVDDDDVPPLM